METENKKQEFITEEMLEFLDDLRESGVTNMFGAASYIKVEYPELNDKQCREALMYWMKTFSERHTK